MAVVPQPCRNSDCVVVQVYALSVSENKSTKVELMQYYELNALQVTLDAPSKGEAA